MLDRLEILQVYGADMAEPAKRALRFASLLAADMGAKTCRIGPSPAPLGHGFYDIDGEEKITGAPADWQAAATDTCRLVLRINDAGDTAGVSVHMPDWESETTLFAGSGLAHLLGDPDRAPLVPRGAFGAHTLGYSVFAALVGLYVKWQRFAHYDCAHMDGVSALAWINWKAAVNAASGEHICRQGKLAEWPVAETKDGYVAFVYNLRDWDQVVEMIDDDALRSEKFASFEGRMKHAATYLNLARQYFADKTKTALRDAFITRSIPSFPVMDLNDLSDDPLLVHRGAIETRNGKKFMRPPYRIEAQSNGVAIEQEDRQDGLPLAGMRVLDLGMITAGAGVSAMLADMGAEVIKIETHERPDPFRLWPGQAGDDGDAPVFKSNNRNKQGLALDLKTESGLAQFMTLVADSDIVLENFRRGVVERLGIGFDALRKVNPRIVLASISSQGADGPGANHTTFGSTLEASSGFAALTHYEDGVPVISGRNLNYPDQIVCLIGGGVIAAAVAEARRRGVGCHVDVAQRDCAIYQIGDVLAAGQKPDDDKNSAMVQLADGDWYGVSGDAIDRDMLATMTAEAAQAHMRGQGGGCRKVASGQDLLDDKALWDKEIWRKSADGAMVKGFPFQYKKQPMVIYANSPRVGEHNDVLLAGA